MDILNRLNGQVLFSAESNNIRGADLAKAYLTWADLAGADLARADLTEANLRGANLRGANLTEASLTGANLTGANLRGANLTGANLTGVNLTEANLTGADLTGVNLTWAVTAWGHELQYAPIQIIGLQWGVTIFDSHIKIGCELHSIAAWRAFNDGEIDSMDEHALTFWNESKSMILDFCKANGRE